jgi:mRNA interferase RelE/StbE
VTTWIVEYTREAESDLKSLDRSQLLQVLKAIDRVSVNPLPNSEGGYGKPLGNRMSINLTGYLKIKLRNLGLRVVYSVVREKGIMRIIVISVRDDDAVYQLVKKRMK